MRPNGSSPSPRSTSGRVRRSAPPNPDGSLQPSVRAFPTPWRLATEYLFPRKLAPRSRALNAFYGAGFRHDEVREIDFAKAAGFLLRRTAFDEIGPFDEEFFLFSEETDWCYRLREAGWKSFFYPGAEIVHVGGASWRAESATLFTEQVRGHLRFLAKHHGQKTADRARRVLLAGLRLRSLFRGTRGRLPQRRRLAAVHALTRLPFFLAAPPLLVVARFPGPRARPRAAWRRRRGACCCPALLARALRLHGAAPAFALSLGAVFLALLVTFALQASLWIALAVLLVVTLAALLFVIRQGPVREWELAPGACSRSAWRTPSRSGCTRWRCAATRSSTRARPEAGLFDELSLDADGVRRRRPAPRLRAFPLWHGFLALMGRLAGVDPSEVLLHSAAILVPLAFVLAYEAGRALFNSPWAGWPLWRGRSRSPGSRPATAAPTTRSSCPRPPRGS